MTVASISPLDLASLGAAENGGPKKAEPDRAQAGKDFEAILLRKMLASLEKTAHLGESKGGLNSGGEIYGNMIVDGLADAIAASGGLGLAKLIEEQLGMQQKQTKPPPPTEGTINSSKALPVTTAPQGDHQKV